MLTKKEAQLKTKASSLTTRTTNAKVEDDISDSYGEDKGTNCDSITMRRVDKTIA